MGGCEVGMRGARLTVEENVTSLKLTLLAVLVRRLQYTS
jgi:hypothetical protein